MPSVELSAGEMVGLYEEKVQRLRADMGYAEQQSREAVLQRDHALREVTTLQQEKTKLVNELEQATQEKQRVLESLAETRKNVEASLAKTEAQAQITITKAAQATQALQDREQTVRQLEAQLVGIKHTLKAQAQEALKAMHEAVTRSLTALEAIPD